MHCISEVEDINDQGDVPVPHVVCVVILYSCIEQFSEVGGRMNGGLCKGEEIGERYVGSALKAAKIAVKGVAVCNSDWLC